MEHLSREELLRRLTQGTQSEAADAAGELARRGEASTEAVEALAAALQRPEGLLELPLEASQTLRALTTIAARNSEAARSLRSLVPMLEDLLLQDSSSDLRFAAASALATLAPDEALESFHHLLRKPGTHRGVIANRLGRLGTSALPTLRQLLEEPPLRVSVLRGLRELEAPGEEAVALVASRLTDAPQAERLSALATLQHWGPRAVSAMPRVRALVGDADPYVQLGARETWKALCAEEPPPLPMLDPTSWDGLYARWVEARFHGQTAQVLRLEETGHHRLAQARAEAWQWMREALAEPHKKSFVLGVLGNAPVPRRLLRPMVAAAVHERSPTRARRFVRPCVETYGAECIRELLREYLATGSTEEQEGAKQALDGCEVGSEVKRGLPGKHPHRSKS